MRIRTYTRPLGHGTLPLLEAIQPQDSEQSSIAELTPHSIKITCAPNNNVLEGTLFTACNTTNAIAINTAPAPPNPSASLSSQPGDYHIIPFAHILSFEIVGLGERAPESNAGFDGAIPSIAKVDMAALKAREEQTIRKMKKKDAQKGKGVSSLAQELYDTLYKLYVLTGDSCYVGSFADCTNTGFQQDGQMIRLLSTTRCLYSLHTPWKASERPLAKNKAWYKLRRLSSGSTRRRPLHRERVVKSNSSKCRSEG